MALLALAPVARAAGVPCDAPSANPASASLLDRADLPPGFGVALDQPLMGGDPIPALTLSLGARSTGGPGARAGHAANPADGSARRIGVSATVGGPTPQGDSDWPSRGLDAPKHETLDMRIHALGTAAAAAGERSRDVASGPRPALRDLNLSFDFAADTYSTGFGRDLYAATLIVESSSALVANVGYRQEERLHHGQRDHAFKLCAGRAWQWRGGPGPLRAIDATLGIGGLLRQHGQRNVRLAGLRLDSPLGTHVRATAAMFVSSLPERTGERCTRAVIGCSYGR